MRFRGEKLHSRLRSQILIGFYTGGGIHPEPGFDADVGLW